MNDQAIGRVKLRVEVSLVEPQLAALLFDALDGECSPVEIAQLSRARVRQLIRDRVTQRGERSVDCGPQDEAGYDERTERSCVSAVRRAYSKEG